MSAEKTFTGFTPEQAAQYAASRGKSYPQPLYDTILEYHNGDRKAFLDVGTGPGKVVFDLMPYFESGAGCDTGEQMIAQAKADAAKRGLADKTSFVVASGEECTKVLEGKGGQGSGSGSGSFDLITVAMAAHWIDMQQFYAAAARCLRPGGTLAIWTHSSFYCHPSVSNSAAIQKVLFDLERDTLKPYMLEGNLLTQNAYVDLVLPWSAADTKSLFDQQSYLRKDWDLNGVPSAPALPDGSPGPFLNNEEVRLEMLAYGLGSASGVIRWREANPEKAGTEDDPIKITMKRLKEASGGRDSLVLGPSTTLLLMRRA